MRTIGVNIKTDGKTLYQFIRMYSCMIGEFAPVDNPEQREYFNYSQFWALFDIPE